MKKNKLNILLIDDRPFGALMISINQINTLCKVTTFNNFGEGVSIPFVFGSIKRNLPLDICNFFNVYWLRHSQDARQYISYLYDIKNNLGMKKLLNINMIPDIVLYDYALTGGMEFQIENPIRLQLAKKIIPNFVLEEYVDKKIEFESIKHIDTGAAINEDNEGAYCGGEILNFFNEFIVVGSATTRKDGDKISGQEVALYEELKKLQNNNTFDIKGEDNLNWSTIIPIVLIKLREEIKQSILDEKIKINLENINMLLKEIDENSKLITYTKFGTRSYPIVGLFINYPKDERQVQINKWLNNILKSLIGEDKLDLYNNAVRIQNDLWETFKSDMFFERVELSEYILRENSVNGLKGLTIDEKKRFNNLKARLCKTVNGELTIINNICRNGDISLLTKKDLEVRKLVILFTVIRLYERWQKFVTNSKNDYNEYFSVAKTQPNFEDLFFALYPFPKEPIVLPFHQVFFKPDDKYSRLDKKSINKSKFKKVSLSNVKPYDNMTKNILDKVGLRGFNKNLLIPNDKTVSKIEKTLIRSFANKIGVQFKNLPEWLK